MTTNTQIWFAIYDRKSGAYLPRTKTRAGATWLEFSYTQPPRLFSRKQDAELALQHWKEGKKCQIWQNDLWSIDLGDYISKITPRDLTQVDPCVVSVLIRQC